MRDPAVNEYFEMMAREEEERRRADEEEAVDPEYGGES